MVLNVEAFIEELYQIPGMELYPRGLYTPYQVEPFILENEIVDREKRVINIEEFKEYPVLFDREGNVVYKSGNSELELLSNRPYLEYRPYNVLIEYIQRYIDNSIGNKRLALYCPINGYDPLIYEEYLEIEEIIFRNFNIIVKDINISRELYTGIDEYIHRFSRDMIFTVRTLGRYINITPDSNIKELRFDRIIEKKAIKEMENEDDYKEFTGIIES